MTIPNPLLEEAVAEEDVTNEFSWINGEDKREQNLKTIYFDFDKYAI